MTTAFLTLGWVAAIAAAVALWRLPAARPRIQPDEPDIPSASETLSDDMDAMVRAVTAPQPVFTVVRLHTGKLAVIDAALTVDEALDVGTQCVQAAIATVWEHNGVVAAEQYANGDQL